MHETPQTCAEIRKDAKKIERTAYNALMATALISLGSNLGDRKATLDAALEQLRQTAGIREVAVSTYHQTSPVGGPPGQPEFLNAAARLETTLSPRALFTQLQRIEQELGRTREVHWGPRTIDLDLLLYDDVIIDEPDLVVPHRLLSFRRFVLEPAAEIAATMAHPTSKRTIGDMLQHLEHSKRIYEVRGMIESIRAEFTKRVATALGLMVARRDVTVEEGSGSIKITTSFHKGDGGIADPVDDNFIAEDWAMDLVYRSPLFSPLRTSQLAQGLLDNLQTGFSSAAVFELDAPNAWLIGASRQVALLGRDADAYCTEFRERLIRVPGLFHTLRLPADDLDRAVREAVAAIQAMQ
jgi:2-amino-4-hydroxy-6-hydroxymethyldihydropteridine diphosphokinase